MSRTPKPPIGFVPVDSEEARGISAYQVVNMARVIEGRWETGATFMRDVRDLSVKYPERHYHVQLPPPVEWEEVWGWGVAPDAYCLYWNGRKVGEIKNYNDSDVFIVTPDHIRNIVRALNEMEGRDG